MGNHRSLPSATRRLFLQQSMLALAALVAPSQLLAMENAAVNLGPRRLRVLSADEDRILAVVADTLIPQGGAFDTGARDIDLALRIDHYLDPTDNDLLTGLRGALLFVEHKSPELIGAPSPFSALSASERERCLLALKEAGPVAVSVFAALRGLCLFYFYTDEHSWPHIGYDGPLIAQSAPNPKNGG
ncbi:gluconate 2-dehydrogenase subunit 3 family protein [Aestuariirhabdus litorea]|uniref:Gluconate 2-dehydrogenase subunit 3 family protein n=1 Tax=Aestuariirhabdus litorea TaxID=2528527 RepID=A0A3P3VRS4_9GAMM|nr:gluconate 2-dehydrogenase subunit 3 family protein [Aestuariirhabdus litorea]RRJ84396.1 gluconate 2-dehydrogenase subunit 3 family protein [Aestuariirhabdus litorea]RWW97620.1 gluconate 2-dehydrogenase subunit 3 family protein [Endozoicomonadaceae bacterium GTF-13]